MLRPIVRFNVDGSVAAGEELRRQVHVAHVVVPGHEPELHRRHPAHRLLLAQPLVERIRDRAPAPRA